MAARLVSARAGTLHEMECTHFDSLPPELLYSVLSCRDISARDLRSLSRSCLMLYATVSSSDFVPLLIEAHLRGRQALRPTAMEHGPDRLSILNFLQQFPKCAGCGAWSRGLTLTESSGCCSHCTREGHRAEARLILSPEVERAIADARVTAAAMQAAARACRR